MAVQIDSIRAAAERVATSHHLEVVDVVLTGTGKQRALQIFLEKDAAGRAAMIAEAQSADAETQPEKVLPSGVSAELLSGITHEDCATFATDFGTLLDVEDLVPGEEYTLEVSSPGLERKLTSAADFQRFSGSLVKVKTFEPIAGTRAATGRMTFADGVVNLDLSIVKQKGKPGGKKPESNLVSTPLANIEKANLVPEF